MKELKFWKVGTGKKYEYIVVFETTIAPGQTKFDQYPCKNMDEVKATIEEQTLHHEIMGYPFKVWLDIIATITTRFRLKDDN